jgi:methylphosphotriester-DNA--protein-cysteine methyltransferase
MTQKELADAAKRKIDESTPEQLGELTVEIIAGQFGVTRSNLSRAFIKYHHITPSRYLEIKRFRTFDILALTGQVRSVRGALKRMDVRNCSHFSRRYKEYRGCYPSETLRKYKKRNERINREIAEKVAFW